MGAPSLQDIPIKTCFRTSYHSFCFPKPSLFRSLLPNLKCLSSHKVLQQTCNNAVIPVTLMRIEIHSSVCPYSNNIHILIPILIQIHRWLKLKSALFHTIWFSFFLSILGHKWPYNSLFLRFSWSCHEKQRREMEEPFANISNLRGHVVQNKRFDQGWSCYWIVPLF